MNTRRHPSYRILPIAFLAFLSATSTIHAADCNATASALAADKGGTVLNVVARENNGNTTCEITLRLPGKNGEPPRVVTRTFSG